MRVPGARAVCAVNHLQCEPESCATDSSPDGGMEGKHTITVNYLFHPLILVTGNPSPTSSYRDGSSVTVAAAFCFSLVLIGSAASYGYDSMLSMGHFAWARIICDGEHNNNMEEAMYQGFAKGAFWFLA